MRTLLVPLLLVFLAFPRAASAETIIWLASGEITNVSDPMDFMAGLTAGTPWSLSVIVDSNAPRSIPAGNPLGCSAYPTGPATLTLGGFTYARAGGQLLTNIALDPGCTLTSVPGDPDGLISFFFSEGLWVQEPGAWDLNAGALIGSYYDLIATDGRLPLTPVPNPEGGQFGGLEFRMPLGGQFTAPFEPTAVVQPTAVPEPATMMLFGAGLAAGIATRARHRSIVSSLKRIADCRSFPGR